jgi:hypothetical protein
MQATAATTSPRDSLERAATRGRTNAGFHPACELPGSVCSSIKSAESRVESTAAPRGFQPANDTPKTATDVLVRRQTRRAILQRSSAVIPSHPTCWFDVKLGERSPEEFSGHSESSEDPVSFREPYRARRERRASIPSHLGLCRVDGGTARLPARLRYAEDPSFEFTRRRVNSQEASDPRVEICLSVM